MNVQEAIERIEKRIVWLKNKLGRLNGIVTHSEEINEIKNEIEALSIVLESAKLLHELMPEYDNGIYFREDFDEYVVYLNEVGYDAEIHMSEEKLKSIGIEVEADE